MTIKKININKIEEFLKGIIEGTTEIKAFKEEVEDIVQTLNSNEASFKEGKISNEVYKDIKRSLGSEKKITQGKISERKNKVLITLSELSKTISENKI